LRRQGTGRESPRSAPRLSECVCGVDELDIATFTGSHTRFDLGLPGALDVGDLGMQGLEQNFYELRAILGIQCRGLPFD
jgi:hypothetical protein